MAISATIDNRAKWCCRFSTDGDELKDIFAFLTVGLHIVTPLHPLLNGKPLKGWLLSPLAQNLRTALLPLYCIERVTVSFSSCKDVADIFMFLTAFTNTSKEIPLSQNIN